MKSILNHSLVAFDREGIFESNATSLIGIDEAGRGAWAGPVVAAAIFIQKEFYESKILLQKIKQANDSKKLTPEIRENLFTQIEELQADGAIRFCAGFSSIEEITQHNILGATKLAMRRALDGLITEPKSVQYSNDSELFSFNPESLVWIDGRPLKGFGYPHKAWVKGDGLSLSIALASVVAKVTRDRYMRALDAFHPQYGFSRNKGYGTRQHQASIRQHGLSSVHRPSFDTSICFQESE